MWGRLEAIPPTMPNGDDAPLFGSLLHVRQTGWTGRNEDASYLTQRMQAGVLQACNSRCGHVPTMVWRWHFPCMRPPQPGGYGPLSEGWWNPAPFRQCQLASPIRSRFVANTNTFGHGEKHGSQHKRRSSAINCPADRLPAWRLASEER